MLSPKGAAFLYTRCAMQPLLEPLVVSCGWELPRAGRSRFIDEQGRRGTGDIVAYLAVPTAIRLMGAHDWPQVRRACHGLLRYAHRHIAKLTGLDPITPGAPAWFAQMAVLPLPPCDTQRLRQRPYGEFAIEVPIITWNERQFVRVSI